MKKQLSIAVAATCGLLALGACSRHKTVPHRNMTPAEASAVKAATAKMPTKVTPLVTKGTPGRMTSGMPATAPPPATIPPPRTGG